MTKSLARALAPEIRVLGVAPGVVDTGFVPGRAAEFNAKAAAGTPLRRVATMKAWPRPRCSPARLPLAFPLARPVVVDGGRSL